MDRYADVYWFVEIYCGILRIPLLNDELLKGVIIRKILSTTYYLLVFDYKCRTNTKLEICWPMNQKYSHFDTQPPI